MSFVVFFKFAGAVRTPEAGRQRRFARLAGRPIHAIDGAPDGETELRRHRSLRAAEAVEPLLNFSGADRTKKLVHHLRSRPGLVVIVRRAWGVLPFEPRVFALRACKRVGNP